MRWRIPCTLPTTKMTLWWRSGACAAVLVLVACTTPLPPGTTQAGSGSGKVPVAQPVLPVPPVPVLGSELAPKIPSVEPPAIASAVTAPLAPDQPADTALPPVACDALPEPQALTRSTWTQRGRASWYGKKFNGRRTASGERFSANALTAAHRSLPMPSYVRVRVVKSGKEVVVRINDRGPFHAARVIDVSHAAAVRLGIVGLGSAEVEIERVADPRVVCKSTCETNSTDLSP